MNVIFISMDTLRADRLSCLGHPRGLTPTLDRIAAEGSLFSRAFASDIPTQPSHTAVFTGRFGINTGIVSHYHPWSNLDEGVPWLPTIFQEKGYATGAVDHLFSMKDWFVRGYADYMSPPGRSRSPGSLINEIAFPWLEKKCRDDVFLFLHYWDPHVPYVPPSPFKERYTAASASWTDPMLGQLLRSRPTYPLFTRNLYDHLDAKPNLGYIADLYDAEVAYLDQELDRLFNHLAELRMLDETVVVLFGDHGENMTEHDSWFDHAGLYDSVVHVPLIIWGPGIVPQSKVDSMVQLVDVKPTIIDLLGMTPVEGLDGRSLVPIMKGEAVSHREVVYLSECTWQAKRGVRTDQWKFIHCTDPGVYPRCEDELYDLRTDPDEQSNVAREHPEVLAEMSGLLSAWVNEHLGAGPDPMLEVVAFGLPAVRRLDDLLAGAEVEPHQKAASHTTEHSSEPTTDQLPVVAGSSALATLPTAAIMAPGAGKVVVGGVPPMGKRKLNRRRAVFVLVAAVLAVLALFFAVSSLASGDVQAAGVLQPAQTVDLNFDSTGPVNSLSVQPGRSVHSGEILATQDSTVLKSKLQADEAKLAADKMLLADGPTPNQTPAQLQSQVAQAQAALTTAQTKATSQAAVDNLAVSNATAQVGADQTMLAGDQASAGTACSPGAPGSTAACDSAEHQVAADQAALSSAQGDLHMAQQTQAGDASNAQSAVAQAQSAVTTATANEAAGTQGQTPTQVSSEQAAVNADEADVAADQKELSQAQVVAPFAGTVVQVNGAAGDLAGPDGVAQAAPQTGVSTPSSGITLFPSAPVTSTDSNQHQQTAFIVLDSSAMDVMAQVGEGDVGSIHVGQPAQVTFPANPGHVYSARVLEVDPAAVNQSGKVYFLIRLGLYSSKWRPLQGPAKLNGLEGLSADVTFD